MPVTFVTAFLDLREDRSKDKSVERCFSLFQMLARSGIRLHLFLSSSYLDLYNRYLKDCTNLFVQPMELEDLPTRKALKDVAYDLPAIRTGHHDTANFMLLMNAKAALVRSAAMTDVYSTSHYAWIDFSICHVFRDAPATLAYLKMLGDAELQPSCLVVPGCWQRGTATDALFSAVNWRFCGGFFLGDKASIASFASLYDSQFAAVTKERRALTWEVNFWAYLESACGWRPQWFAADHNDSIVRVPTSLFRVVASLTTIPPRLPTECRLALDSLLPQVDQIFLTVARSYPRFPGPVTLPAYLQESPYKEKVTVVWAEEDRGPALKVLGAIAQLPANAWVFVCDDDQEYQQNLVQRMLTSVSQKGVYQNHYAQIQSKTSGGMIHGYVGYLIPAPFLAQAPAFPLPDAARFVDDQWMSAYCFRHGIPIFPSGVEEYRDIFKVLHGGWHEKLGTASLSGLANRDMKVAELAGALGLRFQGGVVEN